MKLGKIPMASTRKKRSTLIKYGFNNDMDVTTINLKKLGIADN